MNLRLRSRVCVRLTHRETGVSARGWGRTAALAFPDALRLLRARLWQSRHRVGPAPLVRDVVIDPLTRDDAARLVDAMVDGDLSAGRVTR